jgi:ATP-dependent DNA helicase RecG
MAQEALSQLSQIPLSTLKGVGPSLATKLEKIGLSSVQDILFHLPLRYEDKTRVMTVRDILPGMSTNIIGEITENQITQGKRRMLVVTLHDGTGSIQLCFFLVSLPVKK